ncbi:hypothetical protein [Actinoplanes sp. CA-252034]|uniref:hypothetical protein n=1 Tax=Actinoplanes sp. CA-252034 TaxID=3239906 RepID=UPI003D98E5A6
MRVISRPQEHGVDIYDSELTLVHTVPLELSDDDHGYCVSHSRDRLIHVTFEWLTCLDVEGRELWRVALPPGDPTSIGRTGCDFSADDRRLWVYVPQVMTGRGGRDQWIVLDAVTGAELARHELPTAGQGDSHLAFEDGRMLLDVGEGQDGTQCFLASPDIPVVHLDEWDARVPLDLSPDGSRILTVDHEGEDAAVHDRPGGPPLVRIPLSAFGDLGSGDAFIEFNGGFLDASTVIVVVAGEDEKTEEEWWKHFTLDSQTGEVTGELGISTIDQYDLTPLGDGTYVISDTDGTLHRM